MGQKMYGTKNDHFLKLFPESQLGPTVNDEEVCRAKIEHFLKLSQEQVVIVLKVSLDPP